LTLKTYALAETYRQLNSEQIKEDAEKLVDVHDYTSKITERKAEVGLLVEYLHDLRPRATSHYKLRRSFFGTQNFNSPPTSRSDSSLEPMFNDPNFKEAEQLKQLMLKDIKRQMNGERISEEEVYAYFRDLHRKYSQDYIDAIVAHAKAEVKKTSIAAWACPSHALNPWWNCIWTVLSIVPGRQFD